MDRAVGERGGEGLVDQLVLLDQRQPVERRLHDRDLEMVAAAGAVLDIDLPVREGLVEKRVDHIRCHRQ